jgi:two-component system sensor histidine kinase ChvG
MTTSKTSKPSTGSDTGTRKNRWFRLGAGNAELPEFDQILDFYWGGPERRITGLTVRIIAVNAVALVLLLLGALYLAKYQNNLIEAKLETFNAEVELIAAAIAEGSYKAGTAPGIDIPEAEKMISRLSALMNEKILLFDMDGRILIDSRTLKKPQIPASMQKMKENDTLFTVQVLKDMAAIILAFLPDRRILPTYSEPQSLFAHDYPDAPDALKGMVSFSAWHSKDKDVLLSAAAPLYSEGQQLGAVLLTREAHDIKAGMGEVWYNILKAFMATLIITIMLSIYLSGAIARPLRKLAAAAEGVRKGKSGFNDIPDLSKRHDEIGELSISLRQMTRALSERMDSIESFAADVAHELKNPLTSLRSAVETALIVKNDQDRNKLMGIIKHDVERMDRLISDISHASRLDAELSREALEVVDLKKVLSGLLNAYKDPLLRSVKQDYSWHITTQHDGKTISLDCTKPDEEILVWGLEGHLAQVFENLLSNALSFSPAGGVVSINVTPAKHVTITVDDHGPGIPDNNLETVFDRFYTQRPDHEGYGRHSGLGLSISRQIVIALGGEITAENLKNEDQIVTGARFTVTLNRI